MGRKPKWAEAARAGFPKGTLKLIDSLLRTKDGKKIESQRDFIWEAVKREIERRKKSDA